MTGEQLFQRAAALLGQELPDTAYLRTFALPCINQLLWDTLHCQQALERSRGMEATQRAPRLPQFEEEIPYEDGLVNTCFPYGLAALLVADDDREEYNRFSAEFEQRLRRYCPCEFTALEDF